jgi:hypothetical protein
LAWKWSVGVDTSGKLEKKLSTGLKMSATRKAWTKEDEAILIENKEQFVDYVKNYLFLPLPIVEGVI